jgi:hypothetical protein
MCTVVSLLYLHTKNEVLMIEEHNFQNENCRKNIQSSKSHEMKLIFRVKQKESCELMSLETKLGT